MPKRIQRKRTAGWRMPDNTTYVGRPSRYGNPYTLGRVGNTHRWTGWFVGDARNDTADYGDFPTRELAAARAVDLYREDSWSWSPETIDEIRRDLAGKNLACWCPIDQPCHVDVLLEVANPRALAV